MMVAPERDTPGIIARHCIAPTASARASREEGGTDRNADGKDGEGEGGEDDEQPEESSGESDEAAREGWRACLIADAAWTSPGEAPAASVTVATAASRGAGSDAAAGAAGGRLGVAAGGAPPVRWIRISSSPSRGCSCAGSPAPP